MMSVQDIQVYLPKYLSEDNYRNLLRELESFPNNIDQRMYTTSLPNNVIFQGDGYDSLPFVNLMKLEDGCKYRSGIVLSNTCDMAQRIGGCILPLSYMPQLWIYKNM